MPVSYGKMHDAARCWPEMEFATRDHLDVLERQVKIYDLICQRLYALRDRITIISYEKLVAEPRLAAEAVGAAAPPNLELIDKPSRLAPPDARDAIAKAFEMHGEHFARFYPDIAH